MSAYRRCRRKWYLGTYRRLRLKTSAPPGSALSIGTDVHDALAAYYDPKLKQDPLGFLKNKFDGALFANPAYEDSLTKQYDLCRIMIEGYLEWLDETGADQGITVTGTERMAEVPIKGFMLISKLDAPITREHDGARLAFEHKTVGSLTQPLALLKLDTQLLTEHLILFMDARAKGASDEEAFAQCTGILYNMLRKVKRTAAAKPPFYGREEVPHNIHELRNHWVHVLAIARDIRRDTARLDSGEAHHAVSPPSPRKECTWDCDFFKVCVLADDGSNFEGALANLYEERDPLERYDDAEPL
jgi:hypothetical protein